MAGKNSDDGSGTGDRGPAGAVNDADAAQEATVTFANESSGTAPTVAADTRGKALASASGSLHAEKQPEGDLPDFRTVEKADYRISGELARGGMGRILNARDRRHGRPVAIKELLADSPTLQLRFRREALITARLQHPAIVPVYEAGRWPSGEPFYAMKKVEGQPLDKSIARAKTLTDRLGLLPNVIAVADALAYAHRQRIIHRDLKPANVLVGDFGETVVIDWGLAKDLEAAELATPSHGEPSDDAPFDGAVDDLATSRTALPPSSDDGLTVAGNAMGTPAYMPPEQARGAPVDERADVYALGAILYHALTGKIPYGKSRDPSDAIARVLDQPPKPVRELEPDTPPDLAAIVAKAMARDPDDRYETAAGLAEDLKRFATGQLVGAHEYSTAQLVWRWVGRHRAAVTVGVLMAVVLAVGGALSFRRIAHERDRAEEQRRLAEENRSEVEELLGFMLGDLRGKLEPIGRTDLLGTVAKTAGAYYERRPVNWSRPDEVAKRAAAHENLGNVLSDQGDLTGALVEYRASSTILERLVEIDPDKAEWKHNLSLSHGRVGDVRRAQGDLPGALESYRACKALLEGLVEIDPKKIPWQRHLAWGHIRIGDVLGDQSDLAGALAEFRASKAIFERLAALQPTHTLLQDDLATSHNRVGDALRDQGDLAGALTEYRAGKAIRERLVEKEPKNAVWQNDLALSHDALGFALRAQGDLAAALAEHRASRAIRERLLEIDPNNAGWKRDLSVSHGRIGLVLRDQGDLAGALAEYRTAKVIAEKLAELDPKNPGWQRDLAISHNRIGDMLRAQGDLAGARAEYRAGLAIAERLAAKGPDNAQWQRDLSYSHLRLAPVAAEMGDERAAREHQSRSAEIYERLGALPADFYNAACAYALAGEPDRAFAALEKAVERGYRNAAWAEKDTDLASLRDDPRWQPLLARMKKP